MTPRSKGDVKEWNVRKHGNETEWDRQRDTDDGRYHAGFMPRLARSGEMVEKRENAGWIDESRGVKDRDARRFVGCWRFWR